MNELSNVLHDVLKALGIEGVETVGLGEPAAAAEPGDHHHRPAAGDVAVG